MVGTIYCRCLDWIGLNLAANTQSLLPSLAVYIVQLNKSVGKHCRKYFWRKWLEKENANCIAIWEGSPSAVQLELKYFWVQRKMDSE